VVVRFNWQCHAYRLMTNHYHAVNQHADGNLSKGMRQPNGVYTQWQSVPSTHGIPVLGVVSRRSWSPDSHLLALTRYVVLNQVPAGMVRSAGDWKWSSYRRRSANRRVDWLDVDGLLAQFGSRRSRAVLAYAQFVLEGAEAEPVWQHLNRQAFLGDDPFVARSLKRTANCTDDVKFRVHSGDHRALSLAALANK
jgi:hypothetical protein